ncbi:MAG: hypothetical protein ACYTG0_04540 [Planctomycetota bacterium]|jgi:hypothetical protein
MKSLLARVGLPKAIGLYVDDESVTLSQVVSTPLGPVEIARHTERARLEELPAVVRDLVRLQLGGGKVRRVPVAVGLATERTYFATRPIQNVASNPSPRVLLREALRSANVSVDEMAVDVIRAQPDKRLVASIVSCEKRYLSRLLSALNECGVRPFRVEPMPCAMLRTAARRRRAPRGTKVVLRLFLSDTELLAVLVVRNLPVVWRSCKLPLGDEASAIISATRSLSAVSKDCGVESELDTVIIHGRPDLLRLVEIDWVEEQVGSPVEWFDGPPLDRAQTAFGVAMGCFQKEEGHTFDLAHAMKPRPSFWEIIPWRDVVLQTAMLLFLGLFLLDRCRVVNEEHSAIQTQNAEYLWLDSATDADLQKEKQDLTQKVASMRQFLDGRINWTAYERELAAALPESVYLTSFQGECQLKAGGGSKVKGKPKKSLVLRGAVPIPEDGLMPGEIDVLLNTLRAHPMLKQDFPQVEMTDLAQGKGAREEAPTVSFTVVCTPRGAKKGAQ